MRPRLVAVAPVRHIPPADDPSPKARADVIPDLRDTILNTWRTNNRVTVFLIEHLPPGVWASAVPGAPRRTIRMIAGHMHNARCMWIKTLGQELGVTVPRSVDRRRVGRPDCLGGPGAGLSTPLGGHRGPVAMDQACGGGEARAALTDSS